MSKAGPLPAPADTLNLARLAGRYPNLSAAAEAHPERWGAPALAAAESIDDVEHLTVAEWIEGLDRIDAALRQAIACESCTRVRTPST